MYPAACGSTTVTVSTTSPTGPGTACTATVPNAGTGPGSCRPIRESASRCGLSGISKAPGADVAPARVYPVTSTITCTVPKDPLNTWIQPSTPNRTMTVFATVCPAWKFRFEVPGIPTPDGHTVRYPPPCGPVTVTVATTAPASGSACTAATFGVAGDSPDAAGAV